MAISNKLSFVFRHVMPAFSQRVKFTFLEKISLSLLLSGLQIPAALIFIVEERRW